MRSFKTFLSVIGAVAVLVLAGNTVALATTGHALILGKTNKANALTVLQRTTSGPALKLRTSGGAAPLLVNGHGKVANLNADKVDGLSASALQTGTYVFYKSIPAPVTSVEIAITLPPGTYSLGYSAYLSGGGVDNGIAGCYFTRSVGLSATYVGETVELTKTGPHPSMSGTGVVTVGAGVGLSLYCFASSDFDTPSTEPIQITATRTQLLSGGSIARIAPSARAAGH